MRPSCTPSTETTSSDPSVGSGSVLRNSAESQGGRSASRLARLARLRALASSRRSERDERKHSAEAVPNRLKGRLLHLRELLCSSPALKERLFKQTYYPHLGFFPSSCSFPERGEKETPDLPAITEAYARLSKGETTRHMRKTGTFVDGFEGVMVHRNTLRAHCEKHGLKVIFDDPSRLKT